MNASEARGMRPVERGAADAAKRGRAVGLVARSDLVPGIGGSLTDAESSNYLFNANRLR
jgi:hypothetical protein